MEHTHIILGFLLPPNQNPSETVHPTMCALHHPATRFELGVSLDDFSLFSASPDMSGVAEFDNQLANLIIVVSFIQAKTLRFGTCRLRPINRNTFQCFPHQFEVVPIRPIHGYPDRDACAFRQQAALHAVFGPVCRIGADFFPLPEAPWSSLRPWTATAIPALSNHHIRAIPVSKTSRIPRRVSTLGNAGAPSNCYKCRLRSMHSTDTRFARRTKCRPSPAGRELAGGLLSTHLSAEGAGLAVPFWPTIRPTRANDCMPRSFPW
jgi:hypothetical protein